MLTLDEYNNVRDTDKVGEEYNYAVLRFKDPKNPDFFFEGLEYMEEFTSYTLKIMVGEYEMFVPFHWSILCSDFENVQTIPFYEFSGRSFNAFSMNPLDSYFPNYPMVRIVEVFANTTWSCPPVQDKDMLVVPLGDFPETGIKGPPCIVLGPHKLDINRPISDIV